MLQVITSLLLTVAVLIEVEAAPQRYKPVSSSPTGLESPPPRPWSVAKQQWPPLPPYAASEKKPVAVYPAVESEENRVHECFLPYLNEYLPYFKVLNAINWIAV